MNSLDLIKLQTARQLLEDGRITEANELLGVLIQSRGTIASVGQRWSSADWSKRDMQLAKQFKCSRERVRQVRRYLGKPDPEVKHLWAKTDKLRSYLSQLGGKSDRTATDIAAEFDVHAPTVSRYAKIMGVKMMGGRGAGRTVSNYPINWCLPNRDIERIWRFGKSHNVSALRKRLGMPPSKWDGRKLDPINLPQDYLEAMERERITVEFVLPATGQSKV